MFKSSLQEISGLFVVDLFARWGSLTFDEEYSVIPAKVKLTASFNATPGELENRGFTLKTQQTFSFHTTPEEFEKKLGKKTQAGKSRL